MPVPSLRSSVLTVYAAENEGASLRGQVRELLELGVGKTAAATELTRALSQPNSPDVVLLFGVCGAYPARHRVDGVPPLEVGDLCVVDRELLADEGVETASGFQSIDDLGLGSVGLLEAEPGLAEVAARTLAVPRVPGATVSTCSGNEAASRNLARRTSAAVETMEGAAVAFVCRRHAVPWVQLRCVSNWTGDRDRGRWRLAEAIARVQAAVVKLLDSEWR